MKNFILGFIIAIGIIGLCSFTYFNKSNREIGVYLCEYKLNGHLYVTATQISNYSGVGIIHSPNCNCGKK